MRRIILIWAFLFCGAFYSVAQGPQGEDRSAQGGEKIARLTPEKTNHDFGILKYKGEPVTYDFVFTNTGSAPLLIVRTEANCRCLSVKYPRKPLAPGEKGAVSVTYTPDTYVGRFYNSIDVFSNAADRRLILLVEGETIK